VGPFQHEPQQLQNEPHKEALANHIKDACGANHDVFIAVWMPTLLLSKVVSAHGQWQVFGLH